MTMSAGLDVGFKRTVVCVVDGAGNFGGVERTLMLWRRMLRTGWYGAVHVKSEGSAVGARPAHAGRSATGCTGLLRPFGIRLPSREGTRSSPRRDVCERDGANGGLASAPERNRRFRI